MIRTAMNTTVKRRLGSAAATLALAAGGGLLAASPASAGTSGLTYLPIDTAGSAVQVQSVNSGKCLEVADWRLDEGAPVRQWTCTGGANQRWIFDKGLAINVNSGKCVTVVGDSLSAGAAIEQRACQGGSNQRWGKVNVTPAGALAAVNFDSNLVLDVAGASTADGAPVIQWYPGSGPNQLWVLNGG